MKDPSAEEYSEYIDGCVEQLNSSQAWFARNWLAARKLTETTLKKFRIGYDMDRQSIVIPYMNALGDIRTFRWRSIERNHEGPKYLQPKGDGLHLFRVSASRKPRVWLTEGEFDCMVLEQEGFDAVGVPGASGFKEEWAYLFAYCDMVTVVFDGDEPGVEGAQRISRVLSPFVDKLRLVKMPVGKDVNDLYIEDAKGLIDLVG